ADVIIQAWEAPMAGFILTTDLERDKTLSAAAKAALEQGFHVSQLTDREFAAKRSNLPVSVLMGPFVSYCNFRVSVLENEDSVDVIVQRNSPWWTGYAGVRGVRTWAERLA